MNWITKLLRRAARRTASLFQAAPGWPPFGLEPREQVMLRGGSAGERHDLRSNAEPAPRRDLRDIALEYFDAHPEAKADATAKGMALMREHWRKSHHYEHRNGETKCWVCGESWYAKQMTRRTGFAAKYPRPDTSIEGTIRREEVLYDETVKRCRALVMARFTHPEEVTGEALAELYHTHGCDSSIVEEVLDCRLPESVHTEFMGLMDKERARSRAAQKKEIITARTCETVAGAPGFMVGAPAGLAELSGAQDANA